MKQTIKIDSIEQKNSSKAGDYLLIKGDGQTYSCWNNHKKVDLRPLWPKLKLASGGYIEVEIEVNGSYKNIIGVGETAVVQPQPTTQKVGPAPATATAREITAEEYPYTVSMKTNSAGRGLPEVKVKGHNLDEACNQAFNRWKKLKVKCDLEYEAKKAEQHAPSSPKGEGAKE